MVPDKEWSTPTLMVSPEELPDELDWGTAVAGVEVASAPPPQAARTKETTMTRPTNIER